MEKLSSDSWLYKTQVLAVRGRCVARFGKKAVNANPRFLNDLI